MLAFRLRFVSTALIAAGALAAFGQSAHAQTLIGNGGVASPAPTIGFISAGSQVGTTQVATFDFTNTDPLSNAFNNRVSGTIYSAAFASTATAGSPVDFYYQVVLNNTTNTSLAQLSVAEFTGFTTAVGQTTTDIDGVGPFTGGGVASTSTIRSGDGSGLFFNFATFTSGNSTIQVVRTNSNSTVVGSGSVQGSGVSGTATGPVLVTGNIALSAPEPGTVSLLGMGLASGATGIIARRRRSSAKKA
jgi:hypothetical protein